MGFDRVQHEEIITQLTEDIWKRSTGIQKHVLGINNSNADREISSFNKNKAWCWTRIHICVLSPDLFSLYSEIIMQNIKNIQELK